VARGHRFDFKRLDVYRAAVDYYGWTVEVTAGLSWRHRRLTDQTIGAALSAMGNIGEAAGRRGRPTEVRQFYRYAQGSVHESAAYLDALLRIGAIEPATHDQREEQLADIGSMLTRLIQRETRNTPRR
jgi:four helix bundle protein